MSNIYTPQEKLLFKMLTENTGAALLDSGSAYGRNWERNAKKTIDDFNDEPAVTVEPYTWTDRMTTADLCYSISVFHYLRSQLSLDALCDAFNAMPVDDWDGDLYGVSTAEESWLEDNGFIVHDTINTYNGEDHLSQVLQYTYLTREEDGETAYYILLQIHGGCDVRGGYTNAKLFLLANEYQYDHGYLNPQDVYGAVRGPLGMVYISNIYDGYSLRADDAGDKADRPYTQNEPLPLEPEDTIELFLCDE